MWSDCDICLFQSIHWFYLCQNSICLLSLFTHQTMCECVSAVYVLIALSFVQLHKRKIKWKKKTVFLVWLKIFFLLKAFAYAIFFNSHIQKLCSWLFSFRVCDWLNWCIELFACIWHNADFEQFSVLFLKWIILVFVQEHSTNQSMKFFSVFDVSSELRRKIITLWTTSFSVTNIKNAYSIIFCATFILSVTS